MVSEAITPALAYRSVIITVVGSRLYIASETRTLNVCLPVGGTLYMWM